MGLSLLLNSIYSVESRRQPLCIASRVWIGKALPGKELLSIGLTLGAQGTLLWLSGETLKPVRDLPDSQKKSRLSMGLRGLFCLKKDFSWSFQRVACYFVCAWETGGWRRRPTPGED